MPRFIRMALSGPTPVREPTPSLRSLLELPLRYELDSEHVSLIESLERRVNDGVPANSWLPIYEQALSIAEGVKEYSAGRIEKLQVKLTQLGDPTEIRQRLDQGPRRHAEQARNDAKAAVARKVTEWSERAARQNRQVAEQLRQDLETVQFEVSLTGGKLLVQLEPHGYRELSQHVVACENAWGDQSLRGTDQALSAAAAVQLESLAKEQGLRPPQRPPLAPPPSGQWSPGTLPSEARQVPAMFTAVFQNTRTSVASLAMLVMLGASMLGKNSSVHEIRGPILIVGLPVILAVALMGASSAINQAKENGRRQQEQKLKAFLTVELGKSLDAYQRDLVSRIKRRGEEWQEVIDLWFRREVEPKFRQASSDLQAAAQTFRLQQVKLNEEQMAAKTFLNSLKNLIVELKKRQKQLHVEASRPAKP